MRSPEDISEAVRTITSLINRCEKALPCFAPGTSQHTLLVNRISALRTARSLMTGASDGMFFSRKEIEAAREPALSILRKCEKADQKQAPGSAVHTRLLEQIHAMRVALGVIDETIEIQDFSNRYAVRRLSEKDIPAILSLYEGNPLYFHHFPPAPSAEGVREDFTALPKGKSLKDKYFLGFWDGDELAAVLDLIYGYPDDRIVFIGFFMMAANLQGQGTGSGIVEDICSFLGRRFDYVRLGYVQGNPQAEHFWTKNGFLPTGVVKHMEQGEIVLMQRELHPFEKAGDLPKVIHILGASGSGTTTLGKALCDRFGYTLLDADDYFWEPTDPKYTTPRKVEDRRKLLSDAIAAAGKCVISGSLCGWGDIFIPLFERVILVETPAEIRMDRLRKREFEHFGSRILPGGDMHEKHLAFLAWAARYDTAGTEQRSRALHDEWLRKVTCPVVCVEGTLSIEEMLRQTGIRPTE